MSSISVIRIVISFGVLCTINLGADVNPPAPVTSYSSSSLNPVDVSSVLKVTLLGTISPPASIVKFKVTLTPVSVLTGVMVTLV